MIIKYATDRNYTLKQYEDLEKLIKEKAIGLLDVIKSKKYNPGSGLYYPLDEILCNDNKYKWLIISELKKLSVEFYDNNTLFRY